MAQQYLIYSELGGNLVLDVTGGATAASTPLISFPKNNPTSTNQLFTISADGAITAVNSGLVLDVFGGTIANSIPIIQFGDHGGANQRWVFPGDGTIRLKSNTNYVLDVQGGATAASTPIILYNVNSPISNNQKWYLVPYFGGSSGGDIPK